MKYTNYKDANEIIESINKDIKKKAHDKKWFDTDIFDQIDLPKYDYDCKYFAEVNGEYECDIRMQMVFCSKNCAYSTNNPYRIKLPRERKNER